ncbi:hypothetical protein CB1_000165002 [Camelus ferus]|nr:hypothetical protein CB1_000165002 [Camelus ferus]
MEEKKHRYSQTRLKAKHGELHGSHLPGKHVFSVTEETYIACSGPKSAKRSTGAAQRRGAGRLWFLSTYLGTVVGNFGLKGPCGSVNAIGIICVIKA